MKDKMDNKGFTLYELVTGLVIALIVIAIAFFFGFMMVALIHFVLKFW